MQGGSSNRRGAHEPQRDSTLSRSMVALEETNSVLLRGGSVGQPAGDDVSSSVAPSMAIAIEFDVRARGARRGRRTAACKSKRRGCKITSQATVKTLALP